MQQSNQTPSQQPKQQPEQQPKQPAQQTRQKQPKQPKQQAAKQPKQQAAQQPKQQPQPPKQQAAQQPKQQPQQTRKKKQQAQQPPSPPPKLPETMQETLKSADTEEFIDIHFYRPIGYRSALLFRRAGASPNTVTIIGILLGIAAGICFYYQSIYINITGMALLILANTCDSADGQLARMTGKTSAMGRMLDGFCGDLWFASIYIALTLRLWPDYGLWTLAMTLPAAYSHTIQAAMADYYRNAHLHFLKGKATSELSDYEALLDDYRTRKHSYPTTFHRLAYLLYLNYTCAQQRMAPKFQKLMSALQYSYDDSDPPLHFRKAFRRRSLPLMKYANMLSFNTRAIALFISISINKPWLYLAFELTALNIMLIYMVATHERFSARLTEEL